MVSGHQGSPPSPGQAWCAAPEGRPFVGAGVVGMAKLGDFARRKLCYLMGFIGIYKGYIGIP